MAKFLIVAAVIGVAIFIWMSRRRTDGIGRKAEGAKTLSSTIVPCAHCGVHVPRGDAVLLGDQAYCSDAHRALGLRKPGA
jgi:uncharacterized protein